ncbi:YceI family protein [Sediminibacterium sp.]|uniref:YceI family protein n=1 Tax=Sediminibacterium sp. TaxID=1917865 RepID=UPI0025F7AADE|nr:YceI family protein [Sediminibacterium sp.]MBT9484124.1 polyisoprenoid-binding protein [Sediminibacterium sp.]
MKKIILSISLSFFAIILGLTTSTAQSATQWKLDKSHTSVNFSINHFFSAVTGKFSNFDGSFNFDPNNVAESKADFTIAVKSVNTDDGKRDKHLQSGDFFNASEFPNISFKSTKIEKKNNKEFLVHGQLTIRDKTKDVVLPLKITGEMEHPMMKGTIILGLASNLKINRTEYGVGTGSWAATMVVGDEVDINIHMELNRKK